MKHLLLISLFIVQAVMSHSQPGCPVPSVTGRLIYDNTSQTALRKSMIYLCSQDGERLDSFMTDNSGYYQFCGLLPGTYRLTGSIPYTWGGVNAADALLVLQHFSRGVPLSPFRFTAADVNASGYVNASDAMRIAKRYTQMIAAFETGDWIFGDTAVVVADTGTQYVTLKAICTGDVDGSYMPFMQTFEACGDTLTDIRDLQKYPTVEINSRCWMQRSLNVGAMVISTFDHSDTIYESDMSNNGIIEKYCYNNNLSYCNEYGGLYDWDEMMEYDTAEGIRGICPEGWHIPTQTEMCDMVRSVDTTVDCSVIGYPGTGTDIAGRLREKGYKHWYASVQSTNSSGFTALGSGLRVRTGETKMLQYYAYYNTSTYNYASGRYYSWEIINSHMKIIVGYWLRAHHYGYSVRCIKD